MSMRSPTFTPDPPYPCRGIDTASVWLCSFGTLSQWQLHDEGRAATLAGASGLDSTSMEANELACQRQTEAHADICRRHG
jgi:hypothetical protein